MTAQLNPTDTPDVQDARNPHRYPNVEPSPRFPSIEVDVLAKWKANNTFKRSVEQREAGVNGSNEYVFYDGPPFANGLPHYGHLLTSYVKDVVPRFRTMQGRRVERRFGWDTHGMPAEVQAEKELGVSGHIEIKAFGIGKFNDACRTSVLKYTEDWEEYINRAARWVDFENDYKTLDLPYMESVMWAFKTLYDKGLIYQGYKVMPYCWRCETPLSNTELRMDDAYQQRQDPAVTVRFTLAEPLDGHETAILAWTTTPWTLPSNLALAVGPDIDYAVMEEADGKRYIIAESRLGAYEKELAGATQVGSVKGTTLEGLRYIALFPYFANDPENPNAHQVLVADYVTTEDGTGIVHMAPAYGEEDKTVCDAAGIYPVSPVDETGKFTSLVPDYVGQQVFDANKNIVKDLRADGRLVRLDSYDHSYPHCWRCNSPLIYRALSSWFVEVTKIRDRMVELNQQITWVPEHVKDGSFGKWLANARDWGISRNRFWGSPIPVWQSDNPEYPRVDVYGSLDDLERDFGVRPTDLHRPGIDNLVRPNPDDPTGQSTMRRVTEVLDCWFESGSMPFAQVHYPFENKDWFEHHYPGDFIVEYIGQTRGWFYTLHVLATALFDRPAFRSCLSHGIVLGDDGEKMSKSKSNYPDVRLVFENHGSDAMRWHLMSSPVLRGGDAAVTETGIRESVRQVVLPLWNAWYFLSLYAGAEGRVGVVRTDSPNDLDRYILAKCRNLVESATDRLNVIDLFGACSAIREFLDVLTNWYVRRSRDRFWAGDQDAIDTLHTVLEVLCRVAAPLLPLTTEAVYGGLTGEESVHLVDWPTADSLPSDPGLVSAMDTVRGVCSTALSVRKAKGLRVRLPLASMTVAHPAANDLTPFLGILADELNVKSVLLSTDVDSVGQRQLQVVPGKLGPRIGKDVQKVIGAVKSGAWTQDADTGVITAAGIELQEGEFTLRLVAGGDEGASAALPGSDGIVSLNCSTTPELEAEGVARDAIRAIQGARRDAGLHVSNRITLWLGSPDQTVTDSLRTHTDLIAAEVLATTLLVGIEPDTTAFMTSGEVGDGHSVTIGLLKA
jgi:isoleucyl-tRNA synthetase